MTDKLVKDGKVAVLYSPGYGAGWSTWAYDGARKRMIFHPELAQAVLDGDRAKVQQIADTSFPDEYDGGLDALSVCWVDEGCRFEINEYDGSESVRILGKDDGYVA